MNCCNEFGDCQQGRDCPIRKQHSLNKTDDALTIFMYVITILSLTVMVPLLTFIAWMFYKVI